MFFVDVVRGGLLLVATGPTFMTRGLHCIKNISDTKHFCKNKSAKRATTGTAPKWRATTGHLRHGTLSHNSSYHRSMHLSSVEVSPESSTRFPVGSEMLSAFLCMTMVGIALRSSAGSCLLCGGSTSTSTARTIHNRTKHTKRVLRSWAWWSILQGLLCLDGLVEAAVVQSRQRCQSCIHGPLLYRTSVSWGVI